MSRSVSQRLAGLAIAPAFGSLIGHEYQEYDRLKAHRGKGIIVVANHVTKIDPFLVALAVHRADFEVHFLAKDSLFKLPVAGKALSALKQIPVERRSTGAGKSLEAAQEALDAGGAIIIYPEGTLTRDPDLWPMKGHTGAARLALKTNAPVVPIAQFGAHELLHPYGKKLHVFPRKKAIVRVGQDVDLSEFQGQALTKSLLENATEKMMAAITAELAIIRGEQPPAGRWDRRTDRYEFQNGEGS
ncbi:lysophospholipid acyltransferase family protein [Micrococcoides hystricis]|uniref:Lysophospholipid acyltransferase family protein n=1 Tax=Micrococcoides hystricis TaxID=1572761 RepID=A0ABV6PE42_9MICC